MWNENGDKLSYQYAGTNSNISGALEEGKQGGLAGKFGKLVTGVQRYLVSNLSDPDKQKSIQCLRFQQADQQVYGIRAAINELLRKRVGDYMRQKQIRVGCLTWNCAGNAPPGDLNVLDIVLPRA